MELDATLRAVSPGLLRYCLGKTGDRSLAEELTQDALTALVGRWRRLGPPESPEAFVFGIAKRRAGRAVLRRSLFRPLESVAAIFDRNPDPGERVDLRSRLDEVLDGLSRLASSDREILLLVAASELTLVQAAQVLGISGSAAKMRLHRARKRLNELLEEAREPRANVESTA